MSIHARYSEPVSANSLGHDSEMSPVLADQSSVSAPSSALRNLRLGDIRTCIRFVLACACLLVFSGILYAIVENWASIESGIAKFWTIIALSLPLSGFVYFALDFARMFRVSEDSGAASICSVEVCINNETVLTVRSWWPTRMSAADVERHGVRVAMSSARRWISDNSQPGGKITKIKFTEEAASEICRTFLCDACECHQDSHGQCSVCLEDLEAGHACLRMKKCGHAFHEDCLSTWVAQSGRLACLLCRADHFDLVPQATITKHLVKEEPVVSVLTVAIEEGQLQPAAQ